MNEGLERKCRLKVCKKCGKTQKGEVWRGKEGRKCEAGAGHGRGMAGHGWILSPINFGCAVFVERLMS